MVRYRTLLDSLRNTANGKENGRFSVDIFLIRLRSIISFFLVQIGWTFAQEIV